MNAELYPPSFVDTNVLVYALAADDTKRSPIAQRLVRGLMAAEAFQTSTQVLQELYVTLTRKVRTPMQPDQALRYLDQLAVWPVMIPDYSAIRDAVELSKSAMLSFWDALVVVAAAKSGAKRVYTEDLQDGQTIVGVEIVNPFMAESEQMRPGPGVPAAMPAVYFSETAAFSVVTPDTPNGKCSLLLAPALTMESLPASTKIIEPSTDRISL